MYCAKYINSLFSRFFECLINPPSKRNLNSALGSAVENNLRAK